MIQMFKMQQQRFKQVLGVIKPERHLEKKKMKKVKKILAATDDEDEQEQYLQKYDEYELALEELQAQSFHDSVVAETVEIPSIKQSNRTVTTEASSSSTAARNENGGGTGMNREEKERYKVLQQKLQKAKKLIKGAKDQGDTGRVRKLESKKRQYAAELEELKRR